MIGDDATPISLRYPAMGRCMGDGSMIRNRFSDSPEPIPDSSSETPLGSEERNQNQTNVIHGAMQHRVITQCSNRSERRIVRAVIPFSASPTSMVTPLTFPGM
jgi:hypothetical protein